MTLWFMATSMDFYGRDAKKRITTISTCCVFCLTLQAIKKAGSKARLANY